MFSSCGASVHVRMRGRGRVRIRVRVVSAHVRVCVRGLLWVLCFMVRLYIHCAYGEETSSSLVIFLSESMWSIELCVTVEVALLVSSSLIPSASTNSSSFETVSFGLCCTPVFAHTTTSLICELLWCKTSVMRRALAQGTFKMMKLFILITT